MPRYVALLLIVSAIVPCLFAASPSASTRTYVLEVGVYESIVIDDGELWLGVFPAGTHAEVKRCKIRVRKIANDYAAEGVATKVDAGNAPLFMLKGAARVKPGDVKSLYVMSDNSPSTIAVTLLGKKYVIDSVEGEAADGAPVRRLRLKLGDRRMVLAECPGRDSVRAVWVGDLDGDHRIDIYVRIEHHNYWVEQLLFLSSADVTGKVLTTRVAKLLIRKLE